MTEAVVFGLLALSKAVVIRLVPLVLLVFMSDLRWRRGRYLGRVALVVSAVIVFVLLPIVMGLRGVVFEEG